VAIKSGSFPEQMSDFYLSETNTLLCSQSHYGYRNVK